MDYPSGEIFKAWKVRGVRLGAWTTVSATGLLKVLILITMYNEREGE